MTDALGIAGLIVGVIGLAVAYFSLTSDRFRNFLVQRGIRKLPKAFIQLAQDYRLAHTIPDDPPGSVERPTYDSRVRRKDVPAEGLGRFVQGARINRRTLVKVNDEGYVVALVKLISEEPRSGDAWFIAQAANTQVPPHADHQTLAAISVLADKGLISDQERGQLNEAINTISNRLGLDHRNAISRVRSKLRRS